MDDSGTDRPGVASPDPAPSARIDLRFANFTEFISAYGSFVSEDGMFLTTDSPPAIGSRVTVRFRLDDGFPLILAEAQVVWLGRAATLPAAPAGAGLRFLHLDERSTTLIDHMVAQRKREGKQLFDLARPTPAEPPAAEDTTSAANRDSSGPEGDPWEAKPVTAPDPRPDAQVTGQDVFSPAADAAPIPQSEQPAAELSAGLLSRELADRETPPQASTSQAAIDYAPARPDEEPARGHSWLLQPATLVGVLAAAVLAIWVFSILRADHRNPAQLVAPPATTVSSPPPATPTQVAAAAVAASPSHALETPASQISTPLLTPTAAPLPATPAARPTAAIAPTATASRVVNISWRRTGLTTEVIIEANGRLVPARVRHFTMEDPPRYVLRLLGIREPYEPFELAVDTPQVARIRVGFHEEKTPPELHIVLDLVGTDQRVPQLHLGARSATVTVGTSLVP
ncbi:MAG: PilZ domain-containing protein [Acidobacteria bacterium]|nr:PilZ domain-containing protein [Acidobacteriota bacterium]